MGELGALAQNPILIVSSYALTVIALLFAIYSYIRTRRLSRISYASENVHKFGQEVTKFLDQNSPKQITTRVFYTSSDGHDLEFKKARIDEINLVNRGTEVILGANIIEADPLKIRSLDGEILDFEV